MHLNDRTQLVEFFPEETERDAGSQLREQLRVLREQRWLIVACILLTATAALLYSATKTPQYSASARLLVQPDDLRSILTGNYTATDDPQRQAATDLELLTLPAVAKRVVNRVSFETDVDTLLAQVTAAAEGNSRLLSVTAEGTDPEQTADIANAFAREYVDYRAETISARYRRARAQVLTRLAQVQGGSDPAQVERLREQADSLQLLASQSSDASVVQPAGIPSEPFAPKPTRNIALGLVFGGLIGIALAFLRDKLDRRVKKEEHVRAIFPEVPVIASIPTWNGGSRSKGLEVEGYRNLQTNLSFLGVSKAERTLLITSAVAGEGKSTTALNLALAMAERDDAALLVEADLRRPGLSRELGADDQPGLSMILSGTGRLDDYRGRIEVDEQPGRKGVSVLAGEVDFLPAGPVPPNPQALLSSKRLEEFLVDANHAADTVIVDGPPLGTFADMLPLATMADGVIVVVRLYHSRRDQLQRLREQLAQNAVHPVGIVLFGTSAKNSETYYYKGA